MEELIGAMNQVAADPVSKLFLDVTAGVFVIALIAHFLAMVWRARFLQRISAAAPTLCTTLGVLGTFVGIFIGLLHFDVGSIEKSVPQLLLGLKIAFGTSIVGMSAAILLKVVHVILPFRAAASGTGADDIHTALLDVRAETKRGAVLVRDEVEGLRRAISSDGETSLLSQVQKMRLEMADSQRALIAEFRTFASTMADNNSRAVTEALQQVIRDFNVKITEQFGDNFKKLNEAVGALLIWQTNYRTHIEKLEASFMLALDGVGRAEQSLGALKQHTAAIPETAKEIGLVVGDVRTGIGELSRSLEAFVELRAKAADALPVIEGNVARLTTGFAQLVSESMTQAQTGLSSQQAAFKELHKGYSEITTSASEAQSRFSGAVDATLVAIRQQLDKALHEHGRMIEAGAKQVQDDVTKAWNRTENAINDRMSDLDKQMQEELNRTMRIFGQNLAGLSEKFVQDYTPLTVRLRELLQIARV